MKNKPNQIQHTGMPWETGEFSGSQKISHEFSHAFLMLCKLTDITPKQILIDFADNLSCSSWKKEGREMAREKLKDYFVAHQYGQQYYSQQEIAEIFKDMDAIGRLFPDGDPEMIELYSEWRDRHYQYWFDKWYYKHSRI